MPRTGDTTTQDVSAPPVPAHPAPPPRLLPPLRFLRAMQDSVIAVWPAEAYANPVTEIRVLRRRLITANTPSLVRHVLLDNAANYQKTPVGRRLLEPALGQGLITSEGDTWKRHRQLVAPIFAQRRIASLVPAMAEETRLHLDAWRVGEPFDLARALAALTLGIITRTMFGPENAAEIASIAEGSNDYQTHVRPSLLDFLGAPAWVPRPGDRRARAIGARLTEAIHRVIARRRALAEPRDDLLAVLLDAVGRGDVSERDIRDEIATVFVAGHETTALGLAWAFYLLDLHPHIAQRAIDEVRTVLGDGPPTAEDIERLPVLRMVAEETLRLYPPAHTISRIALGPDRFGDVAVPKGALIVISPWLLHRNPTLWPDPDRFDPDRFAPARAAGRPRFSYLPFGGGPRICVGASFAMAEFVVVLAMVLQSWRVRLVPGHPVEPVGLITTRPRHGLRATVVPYVP